MLYDAAGNRVRKIEESMEVSKAIAYVNGEIIFENAEFDNEVSEYALKYANVVGLNGIEREKLNLDKNISNSIAYFYVKDHLGSTRAVISEDGNRVSADMFYAYGGISPVADGNVIRNRFYRKRIRY